MPAAALSFYTLVVEDDPSASDVLGQVLGRAGIDSVLVTSVSKALLAVEQDWPPAVVLDLRLPDADGTILLRRLKRDSRHTRIAILTGASDLSPFTELHHSKPDAIFYKPVDAEKLLHWLDTTRAEYEHTGDSESDWSVTSSAEFDEPEIVDEAASAPGGVGSVRAKVRHFQRFPCRRTVLIRATGDAAMPTDDTPSRPAKLLDCSQNGIAIAFETAISPGEWFQLSTDRSTSAFTAVYGSRYCAPLPDGGYRVGAELLGVLSGPDEDPRVMLEALLTEEPQ